MISSMWGRRGRPDQHHAVPDWRTHRQVDGHQGLASAVTAGDLHHLHLALDPPGTSPKCAGEGLGGGPIVGDGDEIDSGVDLGDEAEHRHPDPLSTISFDLTESSK